jgi:hypothetical protein
MIDSTELCAGVLHAYDVALPGVARPRARKQLHDHIVALGPASNRWRQDFSRAGNAGPGTEGDS